MKELYDKSFVNFKKLNDILSLDKTLLGWPILTILVRQLNLQLMTHEHKFSWLSGVRQIDDKADMKKIRK